MNCYLKNRKRKKVGTSRDTANRVENANYDKVLFFIDKVLSEDSRFCRCSRCRMDVTALALNTLPPHYCVTSGGNPDKEQGSPWILIEMAVRHSLEKVLAFPHHNRDIARLEDSEGAEGPIALKM